MKRFETGHEHTQTSTARPPVHELDRLPCKLNSHRQQWDSGTPPTDQQVGHVALNVQPACLQPSIMEAGHDPHPGGGTTAVFAFPIGPGWQSQGRSIPICSWGLIGTQLGGQGGAEGGQGGRNGAKGGKMG